MHFGINKSSIIFTADDEFPDCLKCSYVNECSGENCGPEHFWARYCRITNIKDVINNVSKKF